MKFYIARDPDGRRTLHHRQDEAKAQDKNFEKIDIPTDMPGLKAFVQAILTAHDDLRDNCRDTIAKKDELINAPLNRGGVEEVGFLPERSGYAEQSVNWDELFPTLPLAHQLHFAAMAMENARERL